MFYLFCIIINYFPGRWKYMTHARSRIRSFFLWITLSTPYAPCYANSFRFVKYLLRLE